MDARCQRVRQDLENKKKPKKDYTESMRHYRRYLSKNNCDSDKHNYAFGIYEDKFKKELVESLLLAEADYHNIESVFGIPKDIIEIYKELFFDTNKFTTKLDKLSYVESYKDELGKSLKLRALSLGPEFIFFKYGGEELSLELQKKLIKQTYMSHAYLAAEAEFNGINSTTSKNALQFSKTMLKAYEALCKFEDDNSADDDLVKILLKRDTKNTITIAPEINEKEII